MQGPPPVPSAARFLHRCSEANAALGFESINRRNWTKVRMMAMFTSTARGERSTLESMVTPCSLNAKGKALIFLRDAVTNCDRMPADLPLEITIRDLNAPPPLLGRQLENAVHRKPLCAVSATR
jgi:hypothetical protein